MDKFTLYNKYHHYHYKRYINYGIDINTRSIFTFEDIVNFVNNFNLTFIDINDGDSKKYLDIKNNTVSKDKNRMVILLSDIERFGSNSYGEAILMNNYKSAKITKRLNENDKECMYDFVEVREYNPLYNIFLIHQIAITSISKDTVTYNCKSTRYLLNNCIENNANLINNWFTFNDTNLLDYLDKENIHNFSFTIKKDNILKQISLLLNKNITNIYRFENDALIYDETNSRETVKKRSRVI